ncbi:MAG: hypothetical protein FJ295_21370 [Planctomycetes bacterium]|nr:hypothetical protein [Planctomycetota bacterium]
MPALLYEPLKKLLKTLTVEVALPEGFDEIWSAVRAVHTTARVRGWYCVATFRFLDSDLIPVAEVLMDLARYIPDRETLQWVQLGLTDPSSPSAVPTVGRHNPLLRVAAELRRTRVLADRLETFPHSVMLRRGPHFVLVGETPSNLWAWAESLRAAMCEAGLLFLPTGLQADVREAPIHIEGFLVDFADGHARCRLGQYAYTFLQITLHGASFRAPLTQTQARDLLFEWTNSYALGLTDLVCRPPESPESQEILRQIRMILAQAGCPEDVVESLVAQMPGWIQNQMSCFMFDGATYSWLL